MHVVNLYHALLTVIIIWSKLHEWDATLHRCTFRRIKIYNQKDGNMFLVVACCLHCHLEDIHFLV